MTTLVEIHHHRTWLSESRDVVGIICIAHICIANRAANHHRYSLQLYAVQTRNLTNSSMNCKIHQISMNQSTQGQRTCPKSKECNANIWLSQSEELNSATVCWLHLHQEIPRVLRWQSSPAWPAMGHPVKRHPHSGSQAPRISEQPGAWVCGTIHFQLRLQCLKCQRKRRSGTFWLNKWLALKSDAGTGLERLQYHAIPIAVPRCPKKD